MPGILEPWQFAKRGKWSLKDAAPVVLCYRCALGDANTPSSKMNDNLFDCLLGFGVSVSMSFRLWNLKAKLLLYLALPLSLQQESTQVPDDTCNTVQCPVEVSIQLNLLQKLFQWGRLVVRSLPINPPSPWPLVSNNLLYWNLGILACVCLSGCLSVIIHCIHKGTSLAKVNLSFSVKWYLQ